MTTVRILHDAAMEHAAMAIVHGHRNEPLEQRVAALEAAQIGRAHV